MQATLGNVAHRFGFNRLRCSYFGLAVVAAITFSGFNHLRRSYFGVTDLAFSTTDLMPSRLDLRRAGIAPSSAPLSLITDGPMLPGENAVSALDVGPSGTEQFDVGFDREWQGEELVPPIHENDVNLWCWQR